MKANHNMNTTNNPTTIEAARQRIADAVEAVSEWLGDDGTILPDMPPDAAAVLANAYLSAPPEFWQDWQQRNPDNAQAVKQWATDKVEMDALRRVTAALQAAEAYPEGECPPHVLDELAEAIVAAPESYRQTPGMGEWVQWAHQYQQYVQERRDYLRFYEVLDILKSKGEDVASDPACNDLFLEMYNTAPPRFKAEADAILSDCRPQATHVDENGRPVYSLEQVAEVFELTPGEMVQEIERLHTAGLMDKNNLHTGPVYPLH